MDVIANILISLCWVVGGLLLTAGIVAAIVIWWAERHEDKHYHDY